MKNKQTPLASYASLVVIYNFLLGSFISSEEVLEPVSVKDLVLLALSIHKISRTLSKDAVTYPLRVYFAKYKEDLGYGEVNEEPRGQGMRRVIGELLTCNYCMDMWVGLFAFACLRKFPEKSRMLMGLFSTVAAADFLHVLYEKTRTQENILTLEEESREKRAAA